MGFPVVMYGCESWTVKKAECRRIDAFELWCWRRLLRVPWTARRSNQSILKEISPWMFIEAETPILWPPHAKSWLIGKDPKAERDWGQEEKGTTEDEMAGWHHWLDGREFEWTLGVGDGTGRPGVLWFMGLQRIGHDWGTELNGTELNHAVFNCSNTKSLWKLLITINYFPVLPEYVTSDTVINVQCHAVLLYITSDTVINCNDTTSQ